MADDTEEDTPMRTEDESSPPGSGSGSGSDTEGEQVEWMVTARQRRSTAGNRLTSLLQQEEPDDDLELLFAEADDDAGFEDVEADHSDVQMDSSDDDEDQGPTAAEGEDLEGEQELQRQAKAERAKKRKLNDGIPKIFKKKARIDPTASEALDGPRAKKKSERASWIPTAKEAPTRASQRGTTRQSKEQLHAQMVDREKKRLRQLANMEKAAAAKQAAKKPALTQADRLAEAARVEKSNSKSLSRWEEAEQLREEEQRAKLAALSNRHMDGPVITWWSGIAEWVGGKLRQVGKTLTIEEIKEKPKKRKAAEMEVDSEAGPADLSKPGVSTDPDQPMMEAPGLGPAPPPLGSPPPPSNGTLPEISQTLDNSSPPTPPQPLDVPSELNDQTPASPLPELSAKPASITSSGPNNPTSPDPLEPSIPELTALASNPNPPTDPPSILAPPPQPHAPVPAPALDGSAPLPGLGYNAAPQLERLVTSPTSFVFDPSQPPNQGQPSPSQLETAEPPAIEHATRNYLILSNFEETAIKSKDTQTQILFNRKFPKAPKPKAPSICAITSFPAKYRDPVTGLAYCNSYAYKEIQRLKRGEYRWSALVGAYVGQGTYAARGVPPRFVSALAIKTPQPSVQTPAAAQVVKQN